MHLARGGRDQELADEGRGFQFKTLYEENGDIKVIVFDQNGELLNKLSSLDEKYVESIYQGKGEFLGSWETRAEGEKIYNQIISEFIKKTQKSGIKTKNFYNRNLK